MLRLSEVVLSYHIHQEETYTKEAPSFPTSVEIESIKPTPKRPRRVKELPQTAPEPRRIAETPKRTLTEAQAESLARAYLYLLQIAKEYE